MSQQYSYGYGYGYGYGAPNPYVTTGAPPPRPPVSQTITPAVGYGTYPSPAAQTAGKPPPPPTPPAAASPYYQGAVANSQQAAMAASYYNYPSSHYGTYYGTQPTPPRPAAPAPSTTYTPPTYTPSPVMQAIPRPPVPNITSTPTLVSYPASNVTSYTSTLRAPTQTNAQTNMGVTPQKTDTLTLQQKQVIAQYVHAKSSSGSQRPAWWNKKSSGTGQEYYCEVCRISAASAGTYKTHLEGKNHKKKLAQLKLSKPEDKKACEFYCELCDVVCSNADSLEAHNKGTKHQKVLNLHRRLGKPIPAMKLVDNAEGKKVLAGPQITFVGGKTLHSTSKENEGKKDEVKVYPPNATVPQKKTVTSAAKGNTQQEENSIEPSEKDLEPVGENLVKEVKGDPKFPHAQYKCEMCDCYFNDDYAKRAHIKGRRHRLNYKRIYQPDLYVEPTSAQKKEIEKRKRQRETTRGHGQGEGVPEEEVEQGWDGGWDVSMNPDHHHDPHDDILVMDRHKLVYPPLSEMRAIEQVVEDVEKALKAISDDIMHERAMAAQGDIKDEAFRDLKGVMRVGAFAHNLLLKGECSVELVLMCDKKPTMTLFNLVVNRLAVRFESLLKASETENIYNTTPLPDKGMVTIISQVGVYRVIVSVVFSSTLMRQEPSALQQQADQTEGVLNRQYCAAALAALRHTKWFKAMSRDIPASGIVLRVMKDICRRVSAWGVLDSWMLELLVVKCALSSHPAYSQPGDLFRRIMECVASGVFLPGGRGLLDPCEKEKIDVCAPLSATDRSNLTLSAQHALRLIAFKKLHLVLGVDPLPGDVPESPEANGEEDAFEGAKIEGEADTTRASEGDNDDGNAAKKAKMEQ